MHCCGLTAPGSDCPRTHGPVGSGDSSHLVCGLFRMSGGLMSGSCAHRDYGFARMRCRLRRWTLCAWEGTLSCVDAGWWNLVRLIVWAARFRPGRCSALRVHRVREVTDADHFWAVGGGCLLRVPSAAGRSTCGRERPAWINERDDWT